VKLLVVRSRGGPLRARAERREVGASVRAQTGLVVCLLALSACLRFGYGVAPDPAADGGTTYVADAAVEAAQDAASPADGAAPIDGSASSDAAAGTDAAAKSDAAVADAAARPDAAARSDAAAVDDAATASDAAVTRDAGADCSPSAPRDYCLRLPALVEPPTLDGVLDCGPTLIALPANGWNSPLALPSDNYARYAAAWRADGLYFYVEVDDTLRLPALASDVDPWCGDGVELYVDADGTYVSAPDYDDPGAIQLLAAAPARDASTSIAVSARYHTRSQSRASDWSAKRHVMVTRAAGYALEAFVAAAELDLTTWSLQSGATVGLDIAINVSVTDETQSVGCGYYLGQYYLRLSRSPCSSDNCRPYSNAEAFCTAVLE